MVWGLDDVSSMGDQDKVGDRDAAYVLQYS